MSDGSNRLAMLAADIRTEHENVRGHGRRSAECAVAAGRLLAEAKADESIPRKGWERWVENVAGVPHETAKRYLQLFNAVSQGRVSIPDIAEAGQIGALKAVAEKIEEAEAEEEDGEEPDEGETPAAAIWTEDQMERRAEAECGLCVVANMREGADEALLAWAEAEERFVRIDRRSDWGNPFEMPDDGDRAEVVGKFSKFYLPYKDGLLARIPALRGKVLGCWCHPEECHGHLIAELVNREAAGEGPVDRIAAEIAEVDG